MYRLNDVGNFFGETDETTWRKKLSKAREAANQKPKQQMTQEQWNAEWAKLKKGQTMVGLDGVTYTKK